MRKFRNYADLEGFTNLAEAAAAADNTGASAANLNDMNLETLLASTLGPFTFTLASSLKYGIYKVIVYASAVDGSIADWKVGLR